MGLKFYELGIFSEIMFICLCFITSHSQNVMALNNDFLFLTTLWFGWHFFVSGLPQLGLHYLRCLQLNVQGLSWDAWNG